METHGFPAGTFLLNAAVGLVALYLFYTAAVRFLGKKCSWGQVAGRVNIALIAMLYLLVFGAFSLTGDPSAARRIVWAVMMVVFALIALGNMLWVTFTKEDFSPSAPLAYGITLGLYVCLFVAYFFLDKSFGV